MKTQFEILRVTRENTLKAVQDLSDEQLNFIPNGFNNNILWNMGHIVSSCQNLCYKCSGLQIRIPEWYPAYFGKGTGPRQWTNNPDVKEVKEQLIATASMLEQDFEKGIFVDYSEYQTTYGFTIRNIYDAITFSNIHEALHLGVIKTLKRVV